MIGALGHGNDIVNAINACDKRYLKEKCTWLGLQKLMIVNTEWMIMR